MYLFSSLIIFFLKQEPYLDRVRRRVLGRCEGQVRARAGASGAGAVPSRTRPRHALWPLPADVPG